MSIVTTTGFTTADYELWPQSAQMFIYAACFVGGLRRFHDQRHQGGPLRHYLEIHGGGHQEDFFSSPCRWSPFDSTARPVERIIIDLSICYFIVNIFLVLAGGCFMVMVDDMDYVTGMSSVIATLMNIGPGFGGVGPSKNYAFISDVGKWFLSYMMLVGAAGNVLRVGDFLSIFLEEIAHFS